MVIAIVGTEIRNKRAGEVRKSKGGCFRSFLVSLFTVPYGGGKVLFFTSSSTNRE